MKKLLYFLIFGLVFSAKLHAMDEADVGCPAKFQYEAGQEIREGQQGQTVQEQPRIKIQTSDDQEYVIPKKIGEKSLTIKNMLEGLDEDQDSPVSLPVINANLWNKVYPLMEIDTFDDLKKALNDLSNDDLIDVIPAINYLEIVMELTEGGKTKEFNVVDLAMNELMGRIDKKSLTINKYSEQLDNYPANLQKEIVQDLINRPWLGDYKLSQTLQASERFTDLVRSVAWSPDGKRLASGSDDKTIKIWDAESWELLQTLEGHTGLVRSVAWSPDGKRLASGTNDKTIKIWDANSGKLLQTLEGHTGWVNSVAWSPDGKRLASGSANGTIKIWDAESWELLQTLEKYISSLEGHDGSVRSVAWSPDGKRLASGSDDKTIMIWNANSGELLQTLEGHGDWVYSVAWSPDSSKLASGSLDKTVKIWDVESGELLRTLEGHIGWVYSVAWSPDGSKLASGSHDKTIKIWDAESWELLQTLEGHKGVNSVSWSPDGNKIASGSGKTIKIWRISLPQQILDIIVNLPVSQAYAVIKALEDQNLTVDELLILENLPSDLRYLIEAQAGVELLD